MNCRFPWCKSEHASNDPDDVFGNAHVSDPATVGDLKVYTALFGDGPDVVGLVELRYADPSLAVDLTSTRADSLARILARVDGEHAAQVAAAVRTAADRLLEAEGEDL